MNAVIAIVLAIMAMCLTANRKPRFEVPKERGNGANVHWFSLVRDSEAEVRIKQIYFGIGQQFIDAGWNIPNNCFDRMIALVIAQSELVTVNAKGEQTWSMSFITQGPVGDLYRDCWKGVEGLQMKWIDSKDLIAPPNLSIELDEMDAFEPNGAYNSRFVIRHEAHPTNVSRSMYRLTSFEH